MIACMGGWCASRDKCQHYYVHSKIIVERLCGKLEEPEIATRHVQCGLYSGGETKAEIQKNGEICSDIYPKENS